MSQDDHLPALGPRPGRGRRGGEEALEHTDALYNLARHLMGDAAGAEDLVQETYERALRAWDRLAPDANVKAWLCRILWNACMSGHREASRRREVLLGDDATEEGSHGGAPAGGLPEALRRVAVGELEVALHALPEGARAVVLLDAEGFTESEMASVLNCAAGTVKSRLHRARATLRERFKDRDPSPATRR